MARRGDSSGAFKSGAGGIPGNHFLGFAAEAAFFAAAHWAALCSFFVRCLGCLKNLARAAESDAAEGWKAVLEAGAGRLGLGRTCFYFPGSDSL